MSSTTAPFGPPKFSNRQWLWAVSVVLVGHLLTLSHHWGLEPATQDEKLYLPIDLRPVELIDEPTAAASKVRKTPTPAAKSPTVPVDPQANPATVAQFEPEKDPAPAPSEEPPAESAVAPPQAAVSASQASASAPQAPSTALASPSNAPEVTAAVGASASTAASPSEGVEKVSLTVPKVVKFPDSRNWTFTTTHTSPNVNAPNLATDFRWKAENGQYEVYLGAAPLYAAFTKLSRQSKGVLSDVGLQPDTFTATQRDGTRTVSYFDRTKQLAVFGAPGRPPKPLLPGAQDELSAAVQLATLFLGEPDRYLPGERIVMPVVQRTDVQVWVFKVEGEEQLQILRSRVKTIKLTRAPRAQFDTTVTIWLAPEQQYMPVRLRLDYSAERSDDMLWKGF